MLTIFGISIYLQPNDLKECDSIPSNLDGCNKVDAIVAVSGGDTDARTNQAIELYNNGWADKLVFSGAAKDKSGPSNAAAMKAMAMAVGVPEEDILIDEYSTNTTENASNSQTIFAENNINNVILVTSGYHQRRASLEFNRYSDQNVTVLNYPVSSDRDWSNNWWTTARGWWLVVSEFVKIGVFYATGLL